MAAIYLPVGRNDFETYRPLNHEYSPHLLALLASVELWLDGDDNNRLDNVERNFGTLRKDIERGEGLSVKADDPIEVYLAKGGYCYKLVED